MKSCELNFLITMIKLEKNANTDGWNRKMFDNMTSKCGCR